MKSKALITGANSGIGHALVKQLKENNWHVDATYRETNEFCAENKLHVDTYAQVNFADQVNIEQWLIETDFSQYDSIVFVHGTMNPIGKLGQVNFAQWSLSNQVNYLSIVQTLNYAIDKLKAGCRVITLAGGGVNSAPKNYSAYTSSKMALVKINELLAADYPEHIFINVGPGWVDTPIHKQTLAAADLVPEASEAVLERYETGNSVPMELVTKTLSHLMHNANSSYSGRNFCVASKELFNANIEAQLDESDEAFKLRRVAGITK